MRKNFTWLILLLFVSNVLLAQKEILKSDTGVNGIVKFQRYDTSVNPKLIANENNILVQTLKMTPDDSLRLEKTLTAGAFTHKIYQQLYKGYRVVGGTYATHTRNGKIESINGFFQQVGNPNITPGIDEQTALNKALTWVGAKEYGWEDSLTESNYKEQMRDSSATLKPKGELLIVYDDSITHKYRLAYKFSIHATIPLVSKDVFVDAIAGGIIHVENLIFDGNVSGNGTTLYSGTRSITMDSYSSPTLYRLRETRTTNGKTVQIQTFNMQNTGNYNSAVDFSNSSTTWSTDAAMDVHWGTEKVFDYWSSVRNRNSYDGNGSALKGYVHANLPAINASFSNNDNAFWDGMNKRMTYGDGTYGGAEVSIDIIGHEIAHGICQSTANLSSSGESPALNEGLSDIWGSVITNYADPTKQMWLHDYEINYGIRSLSSPKDYGNPDTYQGQYWSSSNDAHQNLTVLSHWFYLLCQGGNGTNDLGNNYSVSGIGIAEAANIVWNAESTGKLLSQSQYADARTAMISAATELYGAASNEVIQTTRAWYAVGVGSDYDFSSMYPISGPAVLCGTGTYAISNLPTGSTILWSANPASSVTLTNNQSSTVTVEKQSSGNVVLTAAISLNGNSFSVSKNITLESYNGPGHLALDVPSQSCLTYGSTRTFNALDDNNQPVCNNPNISEVEWQITDYSNNTQITNYQTQSCSNVINSSISLYLHSNSTPYVIQIVERAKDACGNWGNWGPGNGYYIKPSCTSNFFTISPNPATNTVSIQPLMSTNTLNTSLSNAGNHLSDLLNITQINLYNTMGKLMKGVQFNNASSRVQFNVSDLPAGIYYVEILTKEYKEKQILKVK